MHKPTSLMHRLAIIALILGVSGQACSISLIRFPDPFPKLPTQSARSENNSAPLPMAQTTFVVTIPEPLQAGESLLLTILDEVTGLALNAVSYNMTEREPLTYAAVLPLTLNAIVKYRYVRHSGTQVMEDTNQGKSIRYRMYYVNRPGEIQDIVADWADKAFLRETGTIQGRVLNADTGTPLPDQLVTAGGVQYLTDSAGRFELLGLAAGKQNLVVYALDGQYQTFQQEAIVGPSQTTDVELRLKPARFVSVTFLATTPTNTVPGAPVRIAGNLLQLGNTFADLQGGISTSPDRMPVMALTANGKYSTTISLPAGAYVQYKYTLGDGFWNAEHGGGGEFKQRELIVPDEDLALEDSVLTWQAGPSAPILFEVNVPSLTPPGDIIYIQFNPYGWTEPIPMWPLGNNQWAYKLYSPLNMLGAFGYRYCRNGQCGSTDDLATSGNPSAGREVTTSLTPQDLRDTVSGWTWFESPEATTLIGTAITPRTAGFISGVELQAMYRPNWSYYMPQALANVQALGANEVVFTPTWTFSSISPVALTPIPGQDALWIDSAIMISQARALSLQTDIFPTPRFIGAISDYWAAAPKDAGWWQDWFDHYRAFAVHYADLAAQTGARALILGGEAITPALPGGTLADGSASNLPEDVETKWKAVISEVRQHFTGQLLWALPYIESSLEPSLEFLQETDGVYLLWNAALSEDPNATKQDYIEEAGRLLDNEVSPLPSLLDKPLYLAIAYTSTYGSANRCTAEDLGGCTNWTNLSQPNPDAANVPLDLQEQADIYEAMLSAVNARPWISGVISRGFYPPAALQDKSASVHGKPAADILWYWFPRLTGAVK